MWNHFATAFVLLRGGFSFKELPPLFTSTGLWFAVRATFPADIPTHRRVQDFYFDQQHRLRRLDYTAEVVRRWARAAHVCENFREFDGFVVPTRRTVTALPFGKVPLPFPTLVALEIHDLQPRRAA
jgi:hypothetical protein